MSLTFVNPFTGDWESKSSHHPPSPTSKYQPLPQIGSGSPDQNYLSSEDNRDNRENRDNVDSRDKIDRDYRTIRDSREKNDSRDNIFKETTTFRLQF